MLTLGIASALQDSTLDTSGAGSVNFGGLTAATVAGLTNGGALTLTNTAAAGVTLSVGNNNVSNTSSAAIGGAGGITKIGSGLQALAGINTYGGATNVSAGTLQFQGGSALPGASAVGIGGGVFSIANDGAGSGGTISVGNNITLTAAATVGIDARGLTGATSNNVVSFGTLSNGTSANALTSTINVTGANGYQVSFAGLTLSGSGGNTTTLNANSAPVVINGPVANLELSTTGSHFDTLVLGGNVTGNAINGVISDSPNYTAVGNGDTRITKNTAASLWTLNAANSYHGPTNVTAGTLARRPERFHRQQRDDLCVWRRDVRRLAGQRRICAAERAKSAGAGNATVSGSLAVNSGATVLPGNVASSGTLNVGALTLNVGSVLGYDFNAAGSVDFINVVNALTINGGSIGLYGTNGSSQLTTTGTFPLMDYSSLGGSVANLSVLNPSSSLTYAFSVSGNTVDVTVQQGSGWTGGSGGPTYNWSTGANWASGVAPVSGVAVLFSGTTGLTNTNNIPSLSLPGIVFASGAGAFNISGNSIQLGGSIINNSASTQTIRMPMQLTGGNQTINAASGNLVLAGAISDAGSGYGITTAGANTVTLSAANTFSGPTTASAGRLDLANGLALQNSALTLSGGALLFDPSVSPAAFTLGGLVGGNNITLAANVTGAPVNLIVGNNGAQSSYTGVMSGPGSLTKIGGGSMYLTGANTFTGTTLVANGFLYLANASALLDSTLDTSGAGSVYFGLGAYTVGGLTNGGNLLLSSTASAPVTLSVGNNNAYNLSSANLSGNGGITKIGSGLQALSGNNTYTGATIISAGTLQFLGTTAVNSLPSGGSIQMGANTGLSVHADGTGSGGTISVPGSNIQITAAGTEVIDVGSYLISGNTGNIISLGTLINGATNNAFASTFNITVPNGDKVSFAGLVLAGTTGNNNSINPTTASVIINGPVTNQITTDAAGNFDTLFIQGSSLGNQINGVISDSPNSTVPGYSATRINANGSGQWIITNEQVYTGSTTVSGGTLQLGNGVQDGALYTSTAGSGNTVALSNNAAFIYDLSSNTSVANYVISGSGRVMVLAGEVTAGTANTYTGATTIASGGSLALGAQRVDQQHTQDHAGQQLGAGRFGGLAALATQERPDARRHGQLPHQRHNDQQPGLGNPARHVGRRLGRHPHHGRPEPRRRHAVLRTGQQPRPDQRHRQRRAEHR